MEILSPIYILVALTFIVGFSLGGARFMSAKKGQVDRRYFKLMSGFEPPEYSKKLERNFSNLLELPLLFYIVCILALVLKISSPLFMSLAWAFVSLRVLHTAIHVTYNSPYHRLFVFVASALVLIAMWFELYALAK